MNNLKYKLTISLQLPKEKCGVKSNRGAHTQYVNSKNTFLQRFVGTQRDPPRITSSVPVVVVSTPKAEIIISFSLILVSSSARTTVTCTPLSKMPEKCNLLLFPHLTISLAHGLWFSLGTEECELKFYFSLFLKVRGLGQDWQRPPTLVPIPCPAHGGWVEETEPLSVPGLPSRI